MSPHVFHPFIKHLHAAMNNKQIPHTQRRTLIIGRTIDEAIEEQNSIRWLQALQTRISTKGGEAEALANGQEYAILDDGSFPAFIRMLLRTSKNKWLARNLLQHEATPEACLKKQKDKLKDRIAKLYRSDKNTVSFLNQTRLFRVTLKNRLNFMPHTNKAWLLVIDSAQRAKTRQKAYLMERIPKLTTYKGFHHATAAQKRGPPPETEPFGEVVEDDLELSKHQSTMMDYIKIKDIYRVRIGKKNKTIKKYKKAKLTNYGYSRNAFERHASPESWQHHSGVPLMESIAFDKNDEDQFNAEKEPPSTRSIPSGHMGTRPPNPLRRSLKDWTAQETENSPHQDAY